jgi:hypothetical protein
MVTHIRPVLAAAGLVVASLFAIAPAMADDAAIAQIKSTSGAAFVVRNDNRLPAKPGDFLNEHDLLQTGADGAMGVTFTDNTVLSLGANSEVALAQYAFDSSDFTGSMLTDMYKGTFSMVSGDIARSSPSAMRVRTPNAILGVRGTSFAVEIGGR